MINDINFSVTRWIWSCQLGVPVDCSINIIASAFVLVSGFPSSGVHKPCCKFFCPLPPKLPPLSPHTHTKLGVTLPWAFKGETSLRGLFLFLATTAYLLQYCTLCSYACDILNNSILRERTCFLKQFVFLFLVIVNV